MALHQPILIQPAGGDPSLVTTAQEFRNYTRMVLGSSDVAGTQGITGANAFQVLQATGLSVNVSSGQAVVAGDDVTGQGLYHVWNDATVTVPGFTVPGSGTYHHRLVLQIQDTFSNSAWSGVYQAALTPLLDTGGGLPAEPNSAMTLATIDVPSGSAAITNAMINDFRVNIGQVSVVKTADTQRLSTTTLADDPDLQLTNLNNSSRYWVKAVIFYNGVNQPGDFKYTWRVSSGASGNYAVRQNGLGGMGNFQQVAGAWTDTNFAGASGTGASNLTACVFEGEYQTSGKPAYLVLQWAQNSSTGTNTTVRANSYIAAKRMT